MVRTTSFRLNHPLLAVYEHRNSSYARRPGYVTLSDVAELFESVKQESLEQFVLPPKQPTPDVILRDDILPHRRTHVAL